MTPSEKARLELLGAFREEAQERILAGADAAHFASTWAKSTTQLRMVVKILGFFGGAAANSTPLLSRR